MVLTKKMVRISPEIDWYSNQWPQDGKMWYVTAVWGAIIKKPGNIWDKFPYSLDPIRNFRLFWISDIFENCWPPPPLPLGSNSDIFDFDTFLIKVKLRNNCKIIEIGIFLKNWDPPLDFRSSQIEIGTFLKKKNPPPPIRVFSSNFPFFLRWLPFGENSLFSNCSFCWPCRFWHFFFVFFIWIFSYFMLFGTSNNCCLKTRTIC